MSADNFYAIVPHPKTVGFAAVMVFASDDNPNLKAKEDAQSFPSLGKAIAWAQDQYAEYHTWVTEEAIQRDAYVSQLKHGA